MDSGQRNTTEALSAKAKASQRLVRGTRASIDKARPLLGDAASLLPSCISSSVFAVDSSTQTCCPSLSGVGLDLCFCLHLPFAAFAFLKYETLAEPSRNLLSS